MPPTPSRRIPDNHDDHKTDILQQTCRFSSRFPILLFYIYFIFFYIYFTLFLIKIQRGIPYRRQFTINTISCWSNTRYTGRLIGEREKKKLSDDDRYMKI